MYQREKKKTSSAQLKYEMSNRNKHKVFSCQQWSFFLVTELLSYCFSDSSLPVSQFFSRAAQKRARRRFVIVTLQNTDTVGHFKPAICYLPHIKTTEKSVELLLCL